jgi:hypothetical protein
MRGGAISGGDTCVRSHIVWVCGGVDMPFGGQMLGALINRYCGGGCGAGMGLAIFRNWPVHATCSRQLENSTLGDRLRTSSLHCGNTLGNTTLSC